MAIIRIIKPKDMSSGLSKLNDALMKIETEFLKQEKDQDYYHIVIVGEYTREVCDAIEKNYSDAGWKHAKCKTSSENGERPGLTGLQLYR